MGIKLVGECTEKFAHLNGNPYKVLVWMCRRTLDYADDAKAIPAGLWFADWTELARALGWQARLELAHQVAAAGDVDQAREATENLRNDVSKVCRELVAAGAIEKVPHPNRIDNAAYRLVLEPSKSYLDARKKAREKRGRRRTAEPVDNVLVLDFGTVDTGHPAQGENHPGAQGNNHPPTQGENHPGAQGNNHPPAQGENHPGPTNRNQEPSQEGSQEGSQKKGEDPTRRPAQPPDRARPVDNSPADIWAIMNAGVAGKLAAAAARNARHARPAPVGNVRPDGE